MKKKSLKCPLCGRFTNIGCLDAYGWCQKCQDPLDKSDRLNRRIRLQIKKG